MEVRKVVTEFVLVLDDRRFVGMVKKESTTKIESENLYQSRQRLGVNAIVFIRLPVIPMVKNPVDVNDYDDSVLMCK